MRRYAQAIWHSPTLMTWFSLTIRLGGLALLLPLVLTRLSTAEVLVWQMLSTITMLVTWTDFGFSPTFARIIAFARGGGTLAGINANGLAGAIAADRGGDTRAGAGAETGGPLALDAVIGTQRAIYRRLIIVAMLIALVIGTGVLLRPVGSLPHPAHGWIAWAFTAAAAQFTLLNGSNVAVLTGYDRIATVRRMEAAIGVLQLGSTSMVTLAGGGLIGIVGCYSLWPIALYLLNRRNVIRLGIDLAAIARRGLDPAILAAVWPAAWRSGIGILMSSGIIQASGLVYAQIATAGEAAAYLLALRMFTAISQVSQAPFYARLPAMAHARGRGDHPEVAKLATRGMAMAHWTFVPGALGVAVFAPTLLRMIHSSVHWPGFGLAALLGLAFFAERYGAMHMQLYALTNHIIWHIVNGVTGLLMIVLFVALYPLIGAEAMPVAMLGGYLGFCTWYASGHALASIAAPRWRFERATALGPGLVLVAVLAVAWQLSG